VSILWNPGDHVVQRGIAYEQVWIALPTSVVQDTPERTLLLLVPGTHCKFSAGLVQRKYAGSQNKNQSRWDEQQNPPWTMVDWVWQQRRFLIFMEPESYYSIYMVWDHESDKFQGWYVNFELPFRRSAIGFDTLDLELDLVVSQDYALQWKDAHEYKEGIRRGAITTATAEQVGQAQSVVLEKIERRQEPFDGRWIAWMPDSAWNIPVLHQEWKKVAY